MISAIPAATLLRLGPGLANGMTNLSNARRAGTALINMAGDHAASHQDLDSPLKSDVESAASVVSTWVSRPADSSETGRAVVAAIEAGGVATIIVPADAACRFDQSVSCTLRASREDIAL